MAGNSDKQELPDDSLKATVLCVAASQLVTMLEDGVVTFSGVAGGGLYSYRSYNV